MPLNCEGKHHFKEGRKYQKRGSQFALVKVAEDEAMRVKVEHTRWLVRKYGLTTIYLPIFYQKVSAYSKAKGTT